MLKQPCPPLDMDGRNVTNAVSRSGRGNSIRREWTGGQQPPFHSTFRAICSQFAMVPGSRHRRGEGIYRVPRKSQRSPGGTQAASVRPGRRSRFGSPALRIRCARARPAPPAGSGARRLPSPRRRRFPRPGGDSQHLREAGRIPRVIQRMAEEESEAAERGRSHHRPYQRAVRQRISGAARRGRWLVLVDRQRRRPQPGGKVGGRDQTARWWHLLGAAVTSHRHGESRAASPAQAKLERELRQFCWDAGKRMCTQARAASGARP